MSADEQVLRAAFGPLFAQTIGRYFAQPAPVIDLKTERIQRNREASERRHTERNHQGDAA